MDLGISARWRPVRARRLHPRSRPGSFRESRSRQRRGAKAWRLDIRPVGPQLAYGCQLQIEAHSFLTPAQRCADELAEIQIELNGTRTPGSRGRAGRSRARLS